MLVLDPCTSFRVQPGAHSVPLGCIILHAHERMWCPVVGGPYAGDHTGRHSPASLHLWLVLGFAGLIACPPSAHQRQSVLDALFGIQPFGSLFSSSLCTQTCPLCRLDGWLAKPPCFAAVCLSALVKQESLLSCTELGIRLTSPVCVCFGLCCH